MKTGLSGENIMTVDAVRISSRYCFDFDVLALPEIDSRSEIATSSLLLVLFLTTLSESTISKKKPIRWRTLRGELLPFDSYR